MKHTRIIYTKNLISTRIIPFVRFTYRNVIHSFRKRGNLRAEMYKFGIFRFIFLIFHFAFRKQKQLNNHLL